MNYLLMVLGAQHRSRSSLRSCNSSLRFVRQSVRPSLESVNLQGEQFVCQLKRNETRSCCCWASNAPANNTSFWDANPTDPTDRRRPRRPTRSKRFSPPTTPRALPFVLLPLLHGIWGNFNSKIPFFNWLKNGIWNEGE